MDLSDEVFRVRGRAAKPLAAVVARELCPADLLLLSDEKGVKPSAIKRLSDRHHALARNLAAGMGPSEAGIVAGYSLSRVSILQDDPTFRELLIFYREGVDLQYRDLHEKLSGLASDAADEIAIRLEDDAESISMGQLLEITKMASDRTGHGPSSQVLNVNIDLAARLQSARERVKNRIIEG